MKKTQYSIVTATAAIAISFLGFLPTNSHALGLSMFTGVGEVVVGLSTAGRLVLIPLAAAPALATAKDKAEPAPGNTRDGGKRGTQTGDSGNSRPANPSGGSAGLNEDGTRGANGYGPHLDEEGGRGNESGGPLFRLSNTQKAALATAGLVLDGGQDPIPAEVSLESALAAYVKLGVFSKEEASAIQSELRAKIEASPDHELHVDLNSASDVISSAKETDSPQDVMNRVIDAIAQANGISKASATFILLVIGASG